jgi:dihydropteroate synthase
MHRKKYQLICGNNCLELGQRTHIMGVLNVTPDSFSDGGQFYDPQIAIHHGLEMAENGVDIIDVGGESTRPFADQITTDEEAERVLPIIEKLAANLTIPISIDTTKASVAKRAIEAGASIVNDISSLRHDPKMAELVRHYDVPIILMHMQGTPQNMQIKPHYDALIPEIKTFLGDALQTAQASGISKSKILVDPGFGFGKTFQHNLSLLKHLTDLEDLDVPLVIGTSRKAFIRSTLKETGDPDLSPQLPIVETGSQATVAVAIMNGAHIVRVHSVANTRATAKIVDAINSAP